MKDIKELIGDFDKTEGIRISSSNSYYEIFSKCPNRLQLNIPETAIIRENDVREWIYTKKDEPCKVVKKDEAKINLRYMFYKFTGLRLDDYTVTELKAQKSNGFCAMVSFTTLEKFFVNVEELKHLIENSVDKLQRVQKIVKEGQARHYTNPKNASLETLYCSVTKETFDAPLSFKFFKKSVQYNSVPQTKSVSLLETLLEQLGEIETKGQALNDQVMLLRRKYSSDVVEKLYYKSYDSTLNQNLEKITRKVVDFLETEFRVKIKYFTTKFTLDSMGQPVFLGGNNLIIFPLTPSNCSFPTAVIEDVNNFDSLTLSDLLEYLRYPFKSRTNTEKVELPDETTKVFSDKLFRNMITQTCAGAFCKYHMSLFNGLFEEEDKIISEIPNKRKVYGKLQTKNLPFQIPYSLIKNVFTQKEQVIELLKTFKIYPPNGGSMVLGGPFDYSPKNDDYCFKSPRFLRSHDKVYSMAPICSKCFQIYSLLSRQFERTIVKKPSPSEKKKSWIHTEVKVKDSVKSSQSLYPVMKAAKAQNGIKNPENQITHNLELFIQSQKALMKNHKPGENGKDLLPKIPEINLSLPQEKSPKGLPKLMVTRTPVLEMSKLSPRLKGFNTVADGIGLESSSSHSDFLRRLSMGIVARRESVFIKEISPLSSKPESARNSSRQTARKNIDISKHETFLEFIKQSGFHITSLGSVPSSPKRNGAAPALPPNDILTARFARETALSKKSSLVEKSPKRQRSMSIEQSNEMKKKVMTEVTKNLEKIHKTSSITQSLFTLKKSLFEDKSKDIGIPLSVFHYKNYCARKTPVYKMTVKKFPLEPGSKISKLLSSHNIVDFQTYKSIGSFPNVPISPDDFINIYGYLHEQSLAIPFMILDSDIISTHEPLSVVIICHDFFDSFMEYIELYKIAIRQSKNKRLILFNYPGQSYTIFQNEFISTNEACSEVVDGLLSRLERSDVISVEKDQFSFIGYGYGGNVLLNFLCLTENSVPNFKNILLVNSFAYADDMLTKTLQEMIEIFQNAPDNLPELPYEFYSLLVKVGPPQRNLKEQMAINPISKIGRIRICQGCLNSINLRKKINNLQLNKSIVHSLNNCFVTISHSDVLASNEDERYGTKKNPVVEIYFKKKLHYVDGGHAVLQENWEEFFPKLQDFISEGKI